MSGRAVDTSNSGSGGPGFKPSPSRCFHRQGTLLHFVSLHRGLASRLEGGVAVLVRSFMLRKPVQDQAVWVFGSCAPLPFTSLFAAIAVGVMKLQTQCVVVGRKDQKTRDFL